MNREKINNFENKLFNMNGSYVEYNSSCFLFLHYIYIYIFTERNIENNNNLHITISRP